jgi:hypothetical protein
LRLTVSQVSLIAAGIGLMAPFIAYWTTARLDRERWSRERRSEVYIDMLAMYGSFARHATHPEDPPYQDPSPDQWRLLQARVEAFTSDAVFALRDPFLRAWNCFREEKQALIAISQSDSSAEGVQQSNEQHMLDCANDVSQLYDEIRSKIRQELRAPRQ